MNELCHSARVYINNLFRFTGQQILTAGGIPSGAGERTVGFKKKIKKKRNKKTLHFMQSNIIEVKMSKKK